MNNQSTPKVPAELLNLADEWSPLFKILGDPTRLRLLLAMHHLGRGVATVTELAQHTGIRNATASAALKHMEGAGVLTSERNGREVYYYLGNDHAHNLLHYLGGTHGY